jgi:aminoglycoside phosphotransferase (APT) family kinase protein
MGAPTGRDKEITRHVLEAWLGGELGTPVEVTDVSIPRAGFSNETIVGVARWTDGGGARRRPFVLRIEPSAHQLYAEPDAIRQAEVMRGLAGHVPVPSIWLTSTDRSVFGAPFFLMDHVGGRITPDLPSWHARGWVVDLPPDERGRLYDNGLAAMAGLHLVDWQGRLAFLERAGHGSALDRYIEHVRRWYHRSEESRRWDAETIEAAMRYVSDNRPADPGAQVSWGDARPGNIIYDDQLEVAALLDWEAATIAPVGVDVGWWLMFEEFLCEANGLTRLQGVPGREGTIARYEELSGAPLIDINYYEVLAGLVLSLINSKLADLLITAGNVAPDFAAGIVTRVTGMVARRL